MIWADGPEKGIRSSRNSPKPDTDKQEPQIVWAPEPERKARVAKKVESN